MRLIASRQRKTHKHKHARGSCELSALGARSIRGAHCVCLHAHVVCVASSVLSLFVATTTVSNAVNSISVVVATVSRTLQPRIVPWRNSCATAVRTSSPYNARMQSTASIWCGSAGTEAGSHSARRVLYTCARAREARVCARAHDVRAGARLSELIMIMLLLCCLVIEGSAATLQVGSALERRQRTRGMQPRQRENCRGSWIACSLASLVVVSSSRVSHYCEPCHSDNPMEKVRRKREGFKQCPGSVRTERGRNGARERDGRRGAHLLVCSVCLLCVSYQMCPTKKDKHAPNGAEAECEVR